MPMQTGLVTARIPAPAADGITSSTAEAGSSQPADVVFTSAFTSWSGATARGFSLPEDRLADGLREHPLIRRALVCDPFRSLPRKLARAALRRRDAPFPESPSAAHHAPLRLRRQDPVALERLERAYAAYERGMQRAAVRQGLVRPAIITANPILAGFGDFGWGGPVTYYAWDDWAALEPLRRWWPAYDEAFERLRRTERRVVAVTARIITRIAPTGAHRVVPNGIDHREWQQLPPGPEWFSALPSPRLLYIGSLQSRIDVGQIARLAAAFQEGSITLVGPMQEPAHFEPLRHIANVHIYPPVPRREVTGLIGAADVGLIPHVSSALTEAMSPLKLYEYLAGGLPVAAVDLPGIAGVSDRTVLVPPGHDLTVAVRQALAMGRAPEAQRLAFVADNAWRSRFDALLDLALPDDIQAD
jgi:glycosyltransferase involved in cell wall biosynthesis